MEQSEQGELLYAQVISGCISIILTYNFVILIEYSVLFWSSNGFHVTIGINMGDAKRGIADEKIN